MRKFNVEELHIGTQDACDGCIPFIKAQEKSYFEADLLINDWVEVNFSDEMLNI